MSLENYWRKEIKKKKRGLALLGWPSSLSAHPAARPSLPSPLPRADTPTSLHPAPATWRPYAGVVDAAARPTGLSRSGRHPASPDPPFCSLPAPSPSPLTSASSSSDHRGAIVGRAPPLAAGRVGGPFSAPRPPQCSLCRGKPLRTLYQGESPLRARNLSPEFPRARRSAPPRRNPPISAVFRLFLSALGSKRGEEAQTIPRARSTPPEWSGHGEQRRRAAMHASRGAPVVLRPNQGYPRVRLAAGSTLVLTPWPETSPLTRSARRRCSPSRSRWPVGSGAHCQPQGDRGG